MTRNVAEQTIQAVLDACTDCDTCRYLMDESCLLFPKLYRLYDRQKASGIPIEETELHNLADLCTYCGLCPCPDIRGDLIQFKTQRVRQAGMPLAIRLLADVQRVARLAGRAPNLINRALSLSPIQRLAKKIAGIHPQRSLPQLAEKSFFDWARQKGLDQEPDQGPGIAYFAGCTAGYFFPEVAKAAVEVLAHNGLSVYVPPQQCCGMPTLLEGDAVTTLDRARSNLKTLLHTLGSGYDLVCSCPTCGYLMKILLKENAYYSQAYQHSVNAGADHIILPDSQPESKDFVCLKKTIYAKILKDDRYFSAIDPMDRIALSDSLQDMGAYLNKLQQSNRLNTHFGSLDGHMVYYAPCHQREQGIGSPYQNLLAAIPGLTFQPIGSAMDCCGMGGSLGFKKNFHDVSIKLGTPLIQKIQAAQPTAIITDCLSCRLQFQHMLPFPVYHPLEIIHQAYQAS